jgi:hypothetical protein
MSHHSTFVKKYLMKYFSVFIFFAFITLSCTKEESQSATEGEILLSKVIYEGKGLIYTYSYDKNKRYQGYNLTENGVLVHQNIVTKYNSKNLPTEIIQSSLSNKKISKVTYDYDALGRIVLVSLSDSAAVGDYKPVFNKTLSYDKNKITITMNYNVGTSFKQEVYLDDLGNIRSHEFYDFDGKLTAVYTYEDYDESPNPYLYETEPGLGTIKSKNNYKRYIYQSKTDGTTKVYEFTYTYNNTKFVESVSNNAGTIIKYIYLN